MENSDDIELLRLRALAKLKLQQQQPAETPQEPEKGLMDYLLPSANRVEGEGLGASGKRVGLGVMDALNIPTRALATLSGQSMADPNAYLAKPVVDALKLNTEGKREAEQGQEMDRMGPGGMVSQTAPIGGRSLANMGLETAGRTVSDPVSLWQLIKTAADPLMNSGAKVYESALKPDRAFMKKSGLDIRRDILDEGLGGKFSSGYDKSQDALENLDQQVTDILREKGRPATVTVNRPGASQAQSAERVNIEPNFTSESESIRQPAPDVVYAGGPEAPKRIRPGNPEVIYGQPPRPGLDIPDVMVTPNESEIAPRIDPRFVRPTARSTSNQPPIDDVAEGMAYGIPSERNLPALFSHAETPAVIPSAPVAEDPVAGAIARRAQAGEVMPFEEAMQQAAGEAAERPYVKDITKNIDLRGLLRKTKDDFSREINDFGHAGQSDEIASGIREWESDLNNRRDGPASLLEGQEYKQGVGKMGRWNHNQSPKEIPPKALIANEFYDNIRNDLVGKAPEIAPLNERMSRLIPAKRVLQDATLRTNKNNPISLTDVIATTGALTGAGAVHAATGGLPGLLFGALNRASKSPQVGNMLYQAGKSAERLPEMTAIQRALMLRNGLMPEDDQN